MNKYFFLFLLLAGFYIETNACTNFLITKGATVDGSTMITYAADSHSLYGELYYRAAMNYPENSFFDIYEWDSGKPLGKIKQVRHTYSVVGNINEYQVAIGETTYGGRKGMVDTNAIMDYGSLMYVTLQRAKTAREAIQIIAQLTDEYGYYSSGESFSISDPNEVWIMEMIGKGPVVLKDKDIKKLKETGAKFPYNKGALWVAIRIPDGYISGHANQARITTFPLNDPQNCLYSKDVISFARERGFFKASKDEEFSFADTYCPLDYGSIRFCDARVWCGFLRVNSSMTKYEKYITMGDVSARMPLYIKPDRKLTIADVISLMRDHYEGTPLDMSKDLGGGPFNSPYRWRPMTWKVDNVDYCHERAVSTQQTGFSFVAQSRGWLPSQIGGIIWFSVDDSYSTVYVPMYCGMNRVPQSYAEGNGSLLEFSWDAAFWVFNFVSNFAYTRYSDMIKDIQKTQSELENYFFTSVPMIDKAAADLYKTNPEAAREYITNFSVNQGDMTVAKWRKLGEYLFVKYMDGNIKIEKDGKFQKNGYTQAAQPLHPEYPEKWYRAIIKDNGDALKMKKLQNEDSH